MSLSERIKEQRKKSGLSQEKVKLTLFVIAGYIIVYLAGRIFGTAAGDYSITGWLFGTAPQQLSYLYGWLLKRNLFWIAMAISVIPAIFGKRYFAFITTTGFAIGLLAGELFGPNPAGAAYGHSHYGWAIWICVFAISIIIGVIVEITAKQRKGKQSTQ